MTPGFQCQGIAFIAERLFGLVRSIESVGNNLGRHQVYRIITTERSYALKLYYRANRFINELTTLQMLQRTSFRVPSLVSHGQLDDGTEYLITEWIEGVPFDRLLSSLSDMEKRRLCYIMGERLGEFHRLHTFSQFGCWEEADSESGSACYPNVFLRSANTLVRSVEHMAVDVSDMALLRLAVKRMTEQYHLVNDVREARLCHHDYSDRNVLIGIFPGGPQLVAVIDFEHCCPWDKDFDLIQFYGKMHVLEPRMVEEFLCGYKNIWHDIHAFYSKLDLYHIRELLTACAWSHQRVPDYYRKSLGDLARLLGAS